MKLEGEKAIIIHFSYGKQIKLTNLNETGIQNFLNDLLDEHDRFTEHVYRIEDYYINPSQITFIEVE
ncbi:hypothetical protein CHH61_18865 [Shouchella clausii]|uniref:Condensation domain-containing protein n=1 Tax=Shouchella clausii TaxID=79880 RepID=A0A268RVU9_SHOCL|nr:hypothetical protein [Shouchella clausii]PAF24360.1 hypothetical protein CHH61_18865 [Shouchella clausii]